MSDFKKRFENYEPRKSCKGCVHYENGDWDNDKCLKIECESRCDDEQICMNDLENFYQYGKADEIKEIFDKLHEFLSETRKEYGFTCMESRSDAITDFESWLFEKLKEQKEWLKT